LVLPDEPKITTSGSWYPSQYKDLSEFLNSDPGAINKLDINSRSRRYNLGGEENFFAPFLSNRTKS